ncbi:hypothetical protein BDW71DRAFT_55340 [Aspergillus fruticulosus]
MDEDLIQKYGPGMSFYRTQIKAAQKKKRLGGEAVLTRYCAALRELTISNKLLEGKVKALCSESLRLTFDVTLLKRHMRAFSGELLVTWQADILTRLVEVIYERHGWRMPGEVLVGDKYSLDRDTLSKIYVMAARKIKKETIMKKAVGLSEQYYLALQRYNQVVHLRSTNPFRSESSFARWLVSQKSTRPKMYRFWARLFPVCYSRTIQESSEMF